MDKVDGTQRRSEDQGERARTPKSNGETRMITSNTSWLALQVETDTFDEEQEEPKQCCQEKGEGADKKTMIPHPAPCLREQQHYHTLAEMSDV
jgi:hypothetical protein